MPGFYNNKTFTSRIIVYHLVSMVIMLLATLLAIFFLLQTNEHKFNQKHIQQLLKYQQADIHQALLSPDPSDSKLLDSLIETEKIKVICLERQPEKTIVSWPEHASGDCRTLIDASSANHLVAEATIQNEGGKSRLLLVGDTGYNLDSVRVMVTWIMILLITTIVASYIIYSYTERHYLSPLRRLQEALERLTSTPSSKPLQHNSLRGFSKHILNLIDTLAQQEVDLRESKEKFEQLYSALQESEEYFKALFEKANEGILLLKKPGMRFSHFNQTAHDLLGYGRGKFANMSIPDIFLNTEHASQPVDITADDIPALFSATLMQSSGDSLPCHVSAGDIQIKGQDYRMLMFHDVSEQLNAQRTLSALNSQLQTVLDASKHIAIIAVNELGIIKIFNKGAENILKYDRHLVIGHKKLTDVIKECLIEQQEHPAISEKAFERMVQGMPSDTLMTSTCTYIDAEQNEIPVEQTLTQIIDDAGNHHGYLCIAMDLRDRLAEQKRQSELENQLQHSQKMETIGTLAGGIAHDLNNLLTPVMGYTEMLLEDTRENEKYQRRLNRVLNASLRAKELVKQILTFSHHFDHETEPTQVKAIVKEVLELMFASLPANIQLVVDIRDPEAMINADVTKIHQVLMNLCTNAAHAIGNKNGKITIEIDAIDHDEGISDLVLASGRYVVIAIKDTGCGMPEATIKRIFEPFYTTKEVGEGTGLGLSVVHGIIRSHNGTIRVVSKVNKGSQFYVYLPYYESTTEVSQTQTSTLFVGDKRVMLVDDDLPVLQLSEELLKRKGYQVDAFGNSLDALKAFKLVPDSFDVIITDQSMPEMTGTELARKIHKVRKDIPIILLTGLGNILSQEEQASLGINRVISKPVLSNDLIQIIYEVTHQDSENIDPDQHN
jgi:PAS domain S-box-containing protein